MDLRNKKFLVTGGAGFIGSHMADSLLELGADVFIIDNLSTGRRENLNPKARFYEIGMADLRVKNIFSQEKPEYVYHFAFNTRVPKAVEDPLFDAQSIVGSLNIIKLSQQHGVKKIIFPSSGFVYGNSSPKPTKEDWPIEPISPYVVSKNAVENYLKFFKLAFGLPFVILRYGAVYGPRQVMTGAMQDYFKKLIKGKQAEMYGDPNQKTRDFVFVEDVVRANLLALEVPHHHPDPIFNVATGLETSLFDLYKKIANLLGQDARPICMLEKPGEQFRYSLDCSKIRKDLGWQPSIFLDEGLKKTLEYWQSKIF